MTVIEQNQMENTDAATKLDKTADGPETIVVEVPVPVPTWAAGNAAWWAISVVIAALAIALFTLLRTASNFSEPAPAQAILEAVLEEPTRAAIEAARTADPEAAVVTGSNDLVDFEVRTDSFQADPDATLDRAVRERATELRTDGIVVDPGAGRTQTGVPRRLIESLSAQNHGVVERGVLLSAVLAGALLLFTLMQGRDDNLLMLPAGALAVAWVLVAISLQLLRLVLDGTGPGTSQVLRLVEDAAVEPRQQLTFAVFAAVLGGVAYRLLNQWQGWRRRRALERYRNAVADHEAVAVRESNELGEPTTDVIDLNADEIVLTIDAPSENPSADHGRPQPIPVRVVRRRESVITD